MSDLLSRLERLRGSEKTVGEVGPTLINWVGITWEETKKNPQMLPLLPSCLIQSYQSVCISALNRLLVAAVPLPGGLRHILL